MFKAFLDSSSTSLTDPVSHIRTDYKGNSANIQAIKQNGAMISDLEYGNLK
jgi:hypothetical protein